MYEATSRLQRAKCALAKYAIEVMMDVSAVLEKKPKKLKAKKTKAAEDGQLKEEKKSKKSAESKTAKQTQKVAKQNEKTSKEIIDAGTVQTKTAVKEVLPLTKEDKKLAKEQKKAAKKEAKAKKSKPAKEVTTPKEAKTKEPKLGKALKKEKSAKESKGAKAEKPSKHTKASKQKKSANGLYPPISAYDQGHLQVSDMHTLYYEQSGNPKGKPVVFLHGGPGAGCDENQRRFFDPEAYRIVLFDQRGCGRSTPYANLENNTTWDLVSDIEKLRQHLGIEKWQVFGGSWGSTLALAYAQAHPEAVSEMVLRGIFLCTKEELQWFYQKGGATEVFPEFFEDFAALVPHEERHDMMGAYHRMFHSHDHSIREAALKAWSIWEGRCSKHDPDPEAVKRYAEPGFAGAFSLIEMHYFVHQCWLDHNQLLRDTPRIQHIPCVIVHGRYDMVCPISNAWNLHKAWPQSKIVIVPDAGHAAAEPGIARALVAATDKFAESR